MRRTTFRRIRTSLGWSQDELARQIGLQVTTIREWERGGNPCKGPAAILLALLERRPDVLSILDREHHGLLSAHAIEGSVEWFQLQRLLALIARVERWGGSYWAALVATEKMHRVWLQELETALLLEPVRKYSLAPLDPEMRTTTMGGRLRYHLYAWDRWIGETQPAAAQFFSAAGTCRIRRRRLRSR
jgi:transcriptional regulator with XRE-family HTH domain